MKNLIFLFSALFLITACEEQPGAVQDKQPAAISGDFPTEQDLAKHAQYKSNVSQVRALYQGLNETQKQMIYAYMSESYLPTYGADEMCGFLFYKPRIQNYSYGAGQLYGHCMQAGAYVETLTAEQYQYLELYFNEGGI